MLLNYCDLLHVNEKPQLTYSRIKYLKGALTIWDFTFQKSFGWDFHFNETFSFHSCQPLIFLFSTQKRQIKKKKHRISSSRWQSRRMCSPPPARAPELLLSVEQSLTWGHWNPPKQDTLCLMTKKKP